MSCCSKSNFSEIPNLPIKDRMETYELPQSHAVDILAREIMVMERTIQSKETFMIFLDNNELPYDEMIPVLDTIMKCKRNIEECRKAITWIYKGMDDQDVGECCFCDEHRRIVWEDVDGKKVCESCYARESDTGEVI